MVVHKPMGDFTVDLHLPLRHQHDSSLTFNQNDKFTQALFVTF